MQPSKGMTLAKLLTRLTILGLLIIGSTVAVVAVTSGEQMAAQESAVPEALASTDAPAPLVGQSRE